MAYTKFEQTYVDAYLNNMYPDVEEEEQPQDTMLAAGPTAEPDGQVTVSGFQPQQVKTDVQPALGVARPIPQNKAQEALGYIGELLTKAGVQLDKVGIEIPALGRISLKDLTVGESGKVLEDMALGFYPIEGAGGFISGTTRIKPDPALELLNIAPAATAIAKATGKAAIKGATKAVQATKGMPVGMSTQMVGEGVSELGFYSAAKEAVNSIQQPKGTGEQFLKQIEKTPGVKPEEIKWTGLDDFLKSKKSVTKAEVQEFLDKNRVEVKEVSLADGGLKKKFSVNSPEDQDFYDVIDKQGKVVFTGPEDDADYLIDRSLTKFSKYTLPGGENYREILLTLPEKPSPFKTFVKSMGEKYGRDTPRNQWSPEDNSTYDSLLKGFSNEEEPFRSGHFDQPNILAHLRVNDRVDADGKKVLFVEEVQSDWHQAGRKKGYNTLEQRAANQKKLDALDAERKTLEAEKVRLEELAKPFTNQGKDAPDDILDKWNMTANRLNNLQREYAPIANQLATGSGVPDAPFKTTWHELSMKRAIQLAAEGGYDRVAFTTGKTQAERYDLSKSLESVQLVSPNKNNIEGSIFNGYRKDSNEVVNRLINNEDELIELVGKDVAEKLIAQKAQKGTGGNKNSLIRKLENVDLQVGGEGMKGFYDQILPKFLDKYAKKWDGKVGKTNIQADGDSVAVQYIDVTPKMKESVLTKGQPLFAIGAGGAAVQQEDNQ